MREANDITVPCGDGVVNVRVGALILKDGRLLMVGNEKTDYYYTVGGRIKFGETSEQAVRREVLEETGVAMEIDRLGFIQETYFIGDAYANEGRLVYEIGYYYYMKVPEEFHPSSQHFTEEEQGEYLCWIDPLAPHKYFPDFLHTELREPVREVKYILTDEREFGEKPAIPDRGPHLPRGEDWEAARKKTPRNPENQV